MKTILSVLITTALGISMVIGAESSLASAPISANLPSTDRLPGVDLAEGITQITGTAISPLLCVSSVGAWRYYRTPITQRGSLPWFCHPGVWGFGFLILGACFLKDVIGTVAPPLVKKPLDIAELFESKVSALVASVAFVPFIAAQMAQQFDEAQAHISPSVHLHYASIIPFASVGFDLRLLFIPLGIVAFLLVWMTGHAINVLIALCPFGFIDTLLKIFKMSILGLVVLSYLINPYFGAAISLLIVLMAAILAPPAFRLTVFGTLFASDIITPWRARRLATPTEAHAFLARPLAGVPTRTYGRVARSSDGTICFSFRPWLILPRRAVQLPKGTLAISKGIYFPSLLHGSVSADSSTRIILFLPRYRSHERAIADHFEISDILDSTLVKGFKAAKTWLSEMLYTGKAKYAALQKTKTA
jgi:hypothetical protein